jgi:hypothetical protein
MIRRTAWATSLLLALHSEAGAQAADSAAAARSHYRAALSSLQTSDTAAAVAALGRAANAWPTQGFYQSAYARLAAVAGKSDLAMLALKRLVTLGYGWDQTSPAAKALASTPGYSGLEAAMVAATGPLRKSSVLHQLPDSMMHPEGIAWDGARKLLLVSSVRERKVVTVDARGVVKDLLRPGQDGLDAALAIGVDSVHALLWVASAAIPQMQGYAAADSGRSHLFAFDLVGGKLRRKIRLPKSESGNSVGDLTVMLDGTVYASDTRASAIYRVVADGSDSAVMVAANNPLVRNPQAIVPDGKRLLLADYSLGIQSIDLATGKVHTLPSPPELTVLGIDGMVRLDQHHLLGVQNGVAPPRIVRLTLSPDGSAITEVTPVDRYLPEAFEPTQGVIVGDGYVYLGNSPWENYDDDGAILPGATWPKPILLRLPLK